MRKRKAKGGVKTNCSKCDKSLDEHRVGKYRYCKSCHAEWMRKYRPIHSKLKKHARLKANCRAYLNTYLKRGKVEKKPCCICGELKSQAHHQDYSKPLEVIWYCRPHHLEYHKNNDTKQRQNNS